MYLITEAEQYDYSKKKLPELYQRFNEQEAKHQEDAETLRAKIKRHESIVDNYEMKND